jgi:succinylglutamate desuccinylase
MSVTTDGRTGLRVPRVLGRLGRRGRGPLVVVTAGLHGNEPSGIQAARRVLDRLAGDASALRGELLVAAGNLPALERGVRFVDRDLNRLWSGERVAALRRGEIAEPTVEDEEMLALLDVIEPSIDAALSEGRRVVHVDLHTSSAGGCPFVTCADTLRNRGVALGVPAPLILGLEEQIDGSLIEYVGDKGAVSIASEAGQHDLPSSVDHHEAVLWHVLARARLLGRARPAELDAMRELLERASRGVDRVIEVRLRHRIRAEDRFRMEPGFRNFQRVEPGRLLATDVAGEILAREAGIVLLPLYQGLGEDGFFLGRAVHGRWLALSALLRRLHLSAALTALPGVRREPARNGLIAVSTTDSALERLPLELFYLLGFRKIRRRGARVVITRRRWDLASSW